MKLAEKFGLPLFTFVDTPGAYPGIGAEERGQSEAIGRNLYEMAGLRVPIVVTVIGEGGSGGALAIAIGDVTLMLQYATYSVISPEGCASILWKSAEHAAEAAETLGITAVAPEAARPHRQGRERAARRRASRPRGDDGHAEKGADRGAAPAAGADRSTRCSRRARTRSWLMEVQGDSRRLTTVRRTLRCRPPSRARSRPRCRLADASRWHCRAAATPSRFSTLHWSRRRGSSSAWSRCTSTMDCRRTPRNGRGSAGRFAQSAASPATLRTWPSSAARGSASRPQRDPPATPPSRGLRAIRGCGRAARPPRRRPGRNTVAATAARCRPAWACRDARRALRRRCGGCGHGSTCHAQPSTITPDRAGCATSTTNPTQMHAIVATRCAAPSCRRCAISHPGIRLRSCGPRNCRPMPPRSSTTWPRSTRAMRTTARRSIAPSSRDSTRAAGRTCCGGSCASSDCRRRASAPCGRQLAAPRHCRLVDRHAGAVLGVHRGRLVVQCNRSNPTRACGRARMTCRAPRGAAADAQARCRHRRTHHAATRRSRFAVAARGERLRLPGRARRRNVAELLREAGIPRWERQAMPRIYCGDALAAVAPSVPTQLSPLRPANPGSRWTGIPCGLKRRHCRARREQSKQICCGH